MADIRTDIGGLRLKNPVMTASGTFGYGLEFADLVNLEDIGGIIVKGTTLKPREGNDYPRMAETASGMLNCVGLQNKGVDYFCKHIYPQIKDIGTNMIVNVSGSSIEDYTECAARINELERIPAIELNISCPNVKQGGMAFGVTAKGAQSVVEAVRQVYQKTLIVKLSPNVTDIAEIAIAAEYAGADLTVVGEPWRHEPASDTGARRGTSGVSVLGGGARQARAARKGGLCPSGGCRGARVADGVCDVQRYCQDSAVTG